mmetsp:Transcript_16709/g.35131  ORF Transcript_16709/g.35131 Transcript_16709/m.35131 type:complete len:204 (-) Transcript_16709:251-862(-)
MAALEDCAVSTNRIICAKAVSSPTSPTIIWMAPLMLIVPPINLLPSLLDTGRLSPVSMDSSTEDEPDFTVPSVGTFSPGRTSSMSLRWSNVKGMIRSITAVAFPSLSTVPTNVAESGAISAKADTALDVRDLAFASRYLPISTKDINNELLSKDCINRGLPLPRLMALYTTAEIEYRYAAVVPMAMRNDMPSLPDRSEWRDSL